ncbi:Lysosomal alpha-mannosidase, partial [Clarias magur]
LVCIWSFPTDLELHHGACGRVLMALWGADEGIWGTHLFLPDSAMTASSAHKLLAERPVCGIKDPCYCHHQTIREQSATYGVPFGDGTCGC